MADLTYDSAAVEVAIEDPLCEGAVQFHGWLAPVDKAVAEAAKNAKGDAAATDELKVDAETELVRLYIDPQFLDSLLIKRTDIISKTPNRDDGGSYVLVKREARIRRCQDGRAFWFKRLLDETADDPTARHPRPPL